MSPTSCWLIGLYQFIVHTKNEVHNFYCYKLCLWNTDDPSGNKLWNDLDPFTCQAMLISVPSLKSICSPVLGCASCGDQPIDICKAIYPIYFEKKRKEGGIKLPPVLKLKDNSYTATNSMVNSFLFNPWCITLHRGIIFTLSHRYKTWLSDNHNNNKTSNLNITDNWLRDRLQSSTINTEWLSTDAPTTSRLTQQSQWWSYTMMNSMSMLYLFG